MVLGEIQEPSKQQVAEDKEAPKNKWLNNWVKQFDFPLKKKTNKRYALSFDGRKTRIIEMIKNVWTARLFFLNKFGKEPVT